MESYTLSMAPYAPCILSLSKKQSLSSTLNPRATWLSIISLNSAPFMARTFESFSLEADAIRLWGSARRVDQQPNTLPRPRIPITALPVRVPKSRDLSRNVRPCVMTYICYPKTPCRKMYSPVS